MATAINNYSAETSRMNEMLKWLLLAFYILFICEGSIRKWVLEGQYSTQMFGVKFLPLLLLFVLFFFKKRTSYSAFWDGYTGWQKFTLAIFLLSFPISMQNHGLLVPVLAFISLAAPYVLVYAWPAVLQKRTRLSAILKALMWLVLIADIVALIQSAMPADSLWNVYADSKRTIIALAGRGVRVCSIFNYITPYGNMIIFTTPVFIALFVIFRRSCRWLALLLVGLNLIGAFLTGSRAVVLGVAAIVLASIAIILFSLDVSKANKRLLLAVLLCTPFIAPVFIRYTAPAAVRNFTDRLENIGGENEFLGSDAEERIFGVLAPFAYTQQSLTVTILGYGIGRGTNFFAFSDMWQQKDDWIESGKYQADFGVVGTVFIYIAKLFCAIVLIRTAWTIKSPDLSMVAKLGVLPVIYTMTTSYEYDIFCNIALNTAVGILFAIVRIDAFEACKSTEPS